jgi:hypothetical protein
MLIVLTWILSIVMLLPSYMWPGESIYSFYQSDYYCGIPYENFFGILYTAIQAYFLPMTYLMIIYARLVYFIRRQAKHLPFNQRRRRFQRDLLVTRRILFTINILTLPGLPNSIYFIMTSIDSRLSGSFYMYRLQWMGPTVAMCISSIALIWITPKLRTLVLHRRNRSLSSILVLEQQKLSIYT